MSNPRPQYGSRVAEIRAALCAADRPLSLAEIAASCPSAPTTVQVATALAAELATGRASRDRAAGTSRDAVYRYSITAAGRAAAANPNSLRSARHRRTQGRRNPRLAELVSDAMHTGTRA